MTKPNHTEHEEPVGDHLTVVTGTGPPEGSPTQSIKGVPQEYETRSAIRALAARLAGELRSPAAPTRNQLREVGQMLLKQLSLPVEFLGFAMVAVDNAIWVERFQAVPFDRRLLLLPKCLRDADNCQGQFDSIGLHCAGCGQCDIYALSRRAQELGYQVIVAEGTSSGIMKVLEGEADAVLGVACLDSLDESFERMSDLGIAHQAVPLLCDGCSNTTCELELLRQALEMHSDAAATATRSYLPLLRATRRLFEPDSLAGILDRCTCPPSSQPLQEGALVATDAMAREWLQMGGKRLRPFITLSAYAVGMHGRSALAPDADLDALIPRALWSIAVAIEALHKASLIHDDIEDRDPYRYGKPTMHRTHGTEVAINVGDYLIGLGYRLIAMQAAHLEADCIADILSRLSEAHLQLCCGQGTELVWNRHQGDTLRPVHALQIGALKTGPAFEVALYAGLRAAEVDVDDRLLRQLATMVGEGYQVRNDLADWDDTAENKLSVGQDVLARRPTILRAFLLEAGAGAELDELLNSGQIDGAEAMLEQARHLHASYGAFDKAELLYSRLGQRALALTEQFSDGALQELLQFLVRSILPERPAAGLHTPLSG